MCKLVEGAEFDVAKRTIASTKLADEDELIFIGSASGDGADRAPEPWRMLPAIPGTGSFDYEKTALVCGA